MLTFSLMRLAKPLLQQPHTIRDHYYLKLLICATSSSSDCYPIKLSFCKMATTVLTQNPVLEALAVIQAGIDEFPNPGESHFFTCRSLTKGSKRCQISLKGALLGEIDALLSQFKSMAECPKTDSFYEDMDFFIRSTHCHKHRDAVVAAFTKWKFDLLSSAAPVPPPEAPTESPSTSIDTIFSPAASPSSVDTCQVSPSDGLIYDEPASICGLDENEPLTRSITADTDRNEEAVQDGQSLQGDDAETDDASSYRERLFKYPGLGLGSPRRTRSIRDNSPVLSVIQSRPSDNAMKIGTLYVREHSEAVGFYKIGYSNISAEARLHQPNNCFRENAKIIYESPVKFQGAKHAEKIIHLELWNDSIRISNCTECGGKHREWFKASRDKILQTVRKVEQFLQMPSYIRQGKEWKLSDDAYKLAYTMYGPKALYWRNGQGEDIATGRALDAIQENTPSKMEAETPRGAMEEYLHQGPAQKAPRSATKEIPATPERATEEAPATKMTPIKVAITTAHAQVDVQVLVGGDPSNQDESDEPRTMVIPLRPKPKQAGAGFVRKVGRAVGGLFH
ncbi:hypothetical protein HDV57DRAFT_488724 [Trichoderma longibrachiatum]